MVRPSGEYTLTVAQAFANICRIGIDGHFLSDHRPASGAAPQPAATVEVGLFVDDLAGCLRFYVDVVGFREFAEVSLPGLRLIGLTRAGAIIKLIAREGRIEARNPAGTAVGLRYLTIMVDDVQMVTDRCSAAGHDILRPVGPFMVPGESAPRAVTSIVADPDGNRIEFCQGSAWQAQPSAVTAVEKTA